MKTNENKLVKRSKIVSRVLAVVFTALSISTLFMGNIDVATSGYQNYLSLAGVSTTFNVNGKPHCFHLDTISMPDTREDLWKTYNLNLIDQESNTEYTAGTYNVEYNFIDIYPRVESGHYNFTVYPTIIPSIGLDPTDMWSPPEYLFGWEFEDQQPPDIDIVVRYYDFNSDTALHTYTFNDINLGVDGFQSVGEFDIYGQFYRRMRETGRQPLAFNIDGNSNPVYGFIVDSISIDFDWNSQSDYIYCYLGNDTYPMSYNNEQYSMVMKALYKSLYAKGANSVGGTDQAMDALFAPINSFLNIDLFGTFGIGELLLVAVAILFFGLFLKVFVGG